MDGCKCYDWGVRVKQFKLFEYKDSWNIRDGKLFHRIYFCPFCGERLEASQQDDSVNTKQGEIKVGHPPWCGKCNKFHHHGKCS